MTSDTKTAWDTVTHDPAYRHFWVMVKVDHPNQTDYRMGWLIRQHALPQNDQAEWLGPGDVFFVGHLLVRALYEMWWR